MNEQLFFWGSAITVGATIGLLIRYIISRVTGKTTK